MSEHAPRGVAPGFIIARRVLKDGEPGTRVMLAIRAIDCIAVKEENRVVLGFHDDAIDGVHEGTEYFGTLDAFSTAIFQAANLGAPGQLAEIQEHMDRIAHAVEGLERSS